jgi:hypothetical protein
MNKIQLNRWNKLKKIFETINDQIWNNYFVIDNTDYIVKHKFTIDEDSFNIYLEENEMISQWYVTNSMLYFPIKKIIEDFQFEKWQYAKMIGNVLTDKDKDKR